MVVGLSFGAEGTSMSNQISKAFQAYFPGVCNVASFFNIDGYNKLETLFYDLYYTIPFRNTLFGIEGDNRLAVLYASDNNAKSQILPCVCQLFFYCSILAPMIECLFAKYAMYSYNRSQAQRSVYKLYVYNMCFIYCVLTPIMYNFTIFFTRLFVTILPLTFIGSIIESKVNPDKC